MNRLVLVGLSMLSGAAIGAVAIKGLDKAQAQSKPPTYVVVDIAELTCPRHLPPEPPPSVAAM